MYINVQRLDSSLDQAVKNDERDYLQSDPSAQIVNEPPKEILESGCAVKTQRYSGLSTHIAETTYVVEVTKIGIGGLLLNVVLSSDGQAEITRYQKDYDLLLEHLALVATAQ